VAFHIRFMAKEDIPQVTSIDREAFPTMWPPVNFQHELNNRLAHYIVACNGMKPVSINETASSTPSRPSHRSFMGFRWPFASKPKTGTILTPISIELVCGFVGIWIMVDEAHIINIAVREEYRGNGIGELLIISSINMANKLGASVVTLEVRVSNKIAQNLYGKYGFKEAGIRKGYYTDNKEDALIMTTDIITQPGFKESFQKLKEAHLQKIGQIEYHLPA
jgi:ribosomal-protein-alanine N-acetyltransferase